MGALGAYPCARVRPEEPSYIAHSKQRETRLSTGAPKGKTLLLQGCLRQVGLG